MGEPTLRIRNIDVSSMVLRWPTRVTQSADGQVPELETIVRGYWLGGLTGVRQLTDILPGGVKIGDDLLLHEGSTVFYSGKVRTPARDVTEEIGDPNWDILSTGHLEELNKPVPWLYMGTGTVVHEGATYNLAYDTHRVKYLLHLYLPSWDRETYIPSTPYVTFTTPMPFYKSTVLKALKAIASDPGPDPNDPQMRRDWYINADWTGSASVKFLSYFSRENGVGASAYNLTSNNPLSNEIVFQKGKLVEDEARMVNALVMAGPGGEPVEASWIQSSAINVEVEGSELVKATPQSWQSSTAYPLNKWVGATANRPKWQASQNYALNAEVTPTAPDTWQSGTAYALNKRVRPTAANGKQYMVTIAGTTSGPEPAWPTSPGATVTSGTVTFTCIDIEVLIYRVTTDGGSSGGTEPVWPLVNGATVADGGLVWTCLDLRFVYFKATVPGTSAGTEPVWPLTLGATVVDGGVTWTYLNYADWNAGAFSDQTITTEGGYCEANVDDDTRVAFGFSTEDTNQSWDSIRFGVRFGSEGTFDVVHMGTTLSSGFIYNAGDSIRVDMVRGRDAGGPYWSGVVYRNEGSGYFRVYGVRFTSTQVAEAHFPMHVDAALYTQGDGIHGSTVRRHAYSEHKRQDSIDEYGERWGADVLQDDTLDTVEKRELRANAFFNHRGYPRVTFIAETDGRKPDGTRYQFKPGQTVQVREPKIGWNPLTRVIASVTTEWGAYDNSSWPKQTLEIGDRFYEDGEDDTGFLLQPIFPDTTTPAMPTGLHVQEMGHDGTTTWVRVGWDQTPASVEWVYVRLTRQSGVLPDAQQPPYRFTAERNYALIAGLPPDRTFVPAIAAENHLGRKSTFRVGTPFTTPSVYIEDKHIGKITDPRKVRLKLSDASPDDMLQIGDLLDKWRASLWYSGGHLRIAGQVTDGQNVGLYLTSTGGSLLRLGQEPGDGVSLASPGPITMQAVGVFDILNTLDVTGNLRVGKGAATGKIYNSGSGGSAETVVEMTGDQYGAARFKLQNRNGVNGALFEMDPVDRSIKLVDFIMRLSDGTSGFQQLNQRLEGRNDHVWLGNGGGSEPEWQWGGPDDPGIVARRGYGLGVARGEDLRFLKPSSSNGYRSTGRIQQTWVLDTDSSRKGRLSIHVEDYNAVREVLRMEADGTDPLIGFLGASAIKRPTITGSKGGNAALASAVSALASLGLVTDSST